MPLPDIVDSVTVIEAASPSPAGFGIPIPGVILTAPQIVAWDAFTTDLIVEVAQDTWIATMATLAFSDGEPLYEWLQSAFSQPIVPAKILIGREAVKVAQVLDWKLTAGVQADGPYTVTIASTADPNVSTDYTHTAVGGAETGASIRDALVALFPGTQPVTTAPVATEAATTTADEAGIGFAFAFASPAGTLTGNAAPVANVGLSTDLLAWNGERTDWYMGFELTGDIDVIASVAAVVEAFPRDITFIGESSTSTDADATTGTSSTRGAARLTSFARTGISHRKQATARPMAELAALQLPKDPGATTWSQQEQAVYPGDTWTSTETAALLGQGTDPGRYIYFEKFAALGKGISRNARMGDGTPIDIIRGRDWLNQQIEINVLRQLVAAEKVFYTDAGAQSIVNTIYGTIGSAAPALVVPDSFSVTTTARVDQLPSDIAARVWKGFVWEATLTGAIEAVVIRGKLFITGP